ncbi:MAG TPA: hypothetical protein VK772_18400 [Puia sp.]|jgi:hypothetical protein|nr:hypothetical protein [Puia sp.]
MNKIIATLLLLNVFSASGQEVSFSKDSILINNTVCFRFLKTDSNFSVKSLEGKTLITWVVKNIAPGKFSTNYTFLTVNKEFHNDKMNGRNALIFALVQSDVISDCQLNEDKLLKFIKKHNDQ